MYTEMSGTTWNTELHRLTGATAELFIDVIQGHATTQVHIAVDTELELHGTSD